MSTENNKKDILENHPKSALQSHHGWAPDERHLTLNLRPFAEVIDSLDLSGKTVIEVGVGTGNITQLLLSRKRKEGGPEKVIGYEINSKGAPTSLVSKRFDLRMEDFTTANLEEFKGRDDVVVICNPPYGLFPDICNVVEECGIKHVALMASTEDINEHFQEYDKYAKHSGDDFMPYAVGEHYVIGKNLGELQYREPNIPPANIVPQNAKINGISKTQINKENGAPSV